MSRTIRLGVLIAALLSSCAAMATTASAVTWHNSGDTAYTATGGVTTISSTGVNLVCTTSSFAGTMNATPFVGAVWAATSGSGGFTGCTMSGQNATVSCTYTVTANSLSGSVMFGGADVQCTSRLAGVLTCITQGSVTGTYTNPTPPSTFGSGGANTGGSLRATNGATSCGLGNGDLVHISPTPLRITNASGGPTPHLGPIISRTA